jgi:peptidoglycan/LPS O-acetylase OafA/YrhL
MSLHPVLAPALPSASSALALVNGEPGALPLVLFHTAMRAGIMATGMYVAGHLFESVKIPTRQIVKTSLVSSLAIEAFVLMWAGYQKGKAPPVVT